MSGTIETGLFRGFLAAVLLLPLALGGQRPVAWNLFAVVVAALAFALALRLALGVQRAPVSARQLAPVALPFALALLWAAFQATGGVLTHVSHPLWAEAAAALGAGTSDAISVDPERTIQALLRAASFALVFWLAVQFGRDRERARHAVVAFVAASIAYAAYGLVMHFSGREAILWFAKEAYLGDLTSTFVNRNAYGAYAGLGLLASALLLLDSVRPVLGARRVGARDVAETLLLRGTPYLAAMALTGTALLLSHSRGAFLATALAVLALLLVVAATRFVKPVQAGAFALLLCLVGGGVLGMSGDGTLWRLAETAERVGDAPERMADDARAPLNALTLDAIAAAPLVGHGYGAFLPAFRIYRDTELAAPLVWEFAHNSYLEAAMELGLPSAGLFLLAPLLILLRCIRGALRRRRDQVYSILAVAAAVLAGAHGLVDFSPQIPAVAATLALLLGLGYAQSWSSRDDDA
ncbi:O-antigen ligase family protein [Roseomonas stagni]|uniref:O-antigen ligase family protein n=1 Tax=Falsiroseomonas algicola TaxID=2716930 RepID=A0A6M1LUU3_9PROT|nr:O-antigen ligase family protein [Falsiroseomonas algicola]NGM24211.1 O-antigen ligase family protein [Falsiroseomonas algicola]